jgi:hypothetical protein
VKLAALSLAVALSAENAAVPVNLQLMVMLKVLTYDANFAAHAANPFVVAVPYAKGDESRAAEAVASARRMDLKSINDRTLEFVAVAVGDLGGMKPSAVLLHSGMADDVARDVLAATARAKWYSLSLDEQHVVKHGALLGVTSNAGKPQVVVNITAARATGVELAQAVLKVARTYQ